MRITILGYFHEGSQNGVRIAQAWAIQGHHIQSIDMQWKKDPQKILTTVEKHKPEFILVTMGRDFPAATLQELRDKGYFLANWIPDEYGPDDGVGGQWFHNIKGIYNLFLCETRGIVPLLSGFADKTLWIPQYFDPRYHWSTIRRGDPFNYDVGFLGEPNPDQSNVRLSFLHKLAFAEYQLMVGGMHWINTYSEYLKTFPKQCWLGGGLVNGEMASFYRQTKIALNFINDKLPQYELGFSNRIMKCVGSGGFMLTPDVEGLDEILVPGKHLVTYDGQSYEHLTDKIDYYLKHDSERERIAKAGQQVVLEQYNIDKITKHFLELIKAQL